VELNPNDKSLLLGPTTSRAKLKKKKKKKQKLPYRLDDEIEVTL